jgi:type 1 glutamine amidotransferase
MRPILLLASLVLIVFAEDKQLVIFSKTNGYRHSSAIPLGIEMLRKMAPQNNWIIKTTEDPAFLNTVPTCDAIVLLHISGEGLFNASQKANLQLYLNTPGKGVLGIHAASDAEYRWPWYGNNLIGAYFHDHPAIQRAKINIENADHPTMHPLVKILGGSKVWKRTDEWYNFVASPKQNVKLKNLVVLLSLNESSYCGGTMKDHPIAWCHEVVGGARVFYTALGHTDESYSEDAFHAHISAAVTWILGHNKPQSTQESRSIASEKPLKHSLLHVLTESLLLM